MKIHIVSLFPQLIRLGLDEGVVGRAAKKGLFDISIYNPRDFAHDTHKTVDDRPFGGGDGMLMLAEPTEQAIQQAIAQAQQPSKAYYLSPQGPLFNDRKAQEISRETEILLICGRYGGIDQRLINTYVDEELSIGDYILSGGELAALVVIDAMARYIPGVLGNQVSPHRESFSNGLLEAPQFTRPREILGQSVPDFLLSGHHEVIMRLQAALALVTTCLKRPDLALPEHLGPKEVKIAVEQLLALSNQDLASCGLERSEIEAIRIEHLFLTRNRR